MIFTVLYYHVTIERIHYRNITVETNAFITVEVKHIYISIFINTQSSLQVFFDHQAHHRTTTVTLLKELLELVLDVTLVTFVLAHHIKCSPKTQHIYVLRNVYAYDPYIHAGVQWSANQAREFKHRRITNLKNNRL